MSSTWTLIAWEAVRLSRRRALYAVRVGYVAGMLLVVAGCGLMLWYIDADLGGTWHDRMTRASYASFTFYRDFQFLVGVLLGPALVASACTGERRSGVLRLTKIGPRQFLWGTVGSRLLLPALCLLAALPAGCVLVAIGGVAPWSVFNATANSIAMATVLGAIAGAVTMSTHKALHSTLLAMTWGAFVALGLPVLTHPSVRDHLLARWRDDVFLDKAFSGAPEYLSPVLGALNDTWWGVVPLAALLMVVVGLALFIRRPESRVRWTSAALWTCLTVLCTASLPRDGSASALRMWVVWMTSAISTVQIGRWLFSARYTHGRPPRLWWGHPTPPRVFRMGAARASTALWTLAILLVWWLTPGNVWREPTLPVDQGLLMVGATATAVVTTATVTAARNAGTLTLLQVTPLRPFRVAFHLLLPFLATAVPILMLGAWWGNPAAIPWMGVWAIGTGSLTTAVALRTPPQAAWTLNLFGTIGYLFLLSMLPGLDRGSDVLAFLAPPVIHSSPAMILVSTVIHAFGAGLAFLFLARATRAAGSRAYNTGA
jgi:hypothetical protein